MKELQMAAKIILSQKVINALREGGINADRIEYIPLFPELLNKVKKKEHSMRWLVTSCRRICMINKIAKKKCILKKVSKSKSITPP